MRARRPTAEFTIAFLDVICCGFGAVILLLMITKTVQPQILEKSVIEADGRVAKLTEQLFEIRGETRILNRDLQVKREQLDDSNERIAILQAALARTKARYEELDSTQNSNSIIEQQLAIARQRLSEEEKRLLAAQADRKSDYVGGIPIDSEYIIFIIDTSGSMFSYAWERMLKEMEATLNIYPEVKGIQVMNDMGNYLFSRYQGEWIPDTPARRQLILRNLANWNVFSNSSPVEGITNAVRSFYDPGKKISIYVFGDEFTGTSIRDVVQTVDRLNAENAVGERRVRIHAVGFPVQFIRPPQLQTTGIRFATLMRELTYKNGGTFVGLNDFRP